MGNVFFMGFQVIPANSIRGNNTVTFLQATSFQQPQQQQQQNTQQQEQIQQQSEQMTIDQQNQQVKKMKITNFQMIQNFNP